MRYVSTRGGAAPVGFSEALLAGLAPDGGLYVPETWPAFTKAEIAAFAGKPYAEVAAEVLARFVGDDIPRAVIDRLTAEAYATFAHPAVTPLKQLDSGLWLLELFHGPTLAFKDVAMQLLARLYDHVLESAQAHPDHRLRHLRAIPAGRRWRPFAARPTPASWSCSLRGGSPRCSGAS